MLGYPVINALVKECGASDRQTLSSYLTHADSEDDARKMIETLRGTQPAIFRTTRDYERRR